MMEYQVIINENEMNLIQERLVAQILERNPDPGKVLFVGIQRRGADMAARLARGISEKLGTEILSGTLDINLYRDDWTINSGARPHIGKSEMPCALDGRKILLVDDVLFTGRTIRAALEALLDYGRPESVELLAFIDRGNRELPICADYVGRKIWTEKTQHVDVLLRERDGRDEVRITA